MCLETCQRGRFDKLCLNCLASLMKYLFLCLYLYSRFLADVLSGIWVTFKQCIDMTLTYLFSFCSYPHHAAGKRTSAKALCRSKNDLLAMLIRNQQVSLMPGNVSASVWDANKLFHSVSFQSSGVRAKRPEEERVGEEESGGPTGWRPLLHWIQPLWGAL